MKRCFFVTMISRAEQNINSKVKPHSIPNNKTVNLCFINDTDCTVLIIWLNFKGDPVIYAFLKSYSKVQIHTYENHPWVVENPVTGDRLLLSGQKIYYPVQVKENEITNVVVTRPLLTLREYALRRVRDSITEIEDLQPSDIPNTLINDISKAMALKRLTLMSYRKYKRYQSSIHY